MKVNRKEERLGLRVALSEKWRSGDLAVVDRLAVASEPSTRKLATKLGARDWSDALFVLAADPASRPLGSTEAWESHLFELSAGNLPTVAVVSELDKLGTWDVVRRRKVVVEVEAVEALCQRLDPDNVLGYGDEELDFEEGEEEWLAEEAEGLEEELNKAGVQI
jgi:large subunit ribosomal protein L4